MIPMIPMMILCLTKINCTLTNRENFGYENSIPHQPHCHENQKKNILLGYLVEINIRFREISLGGIENAGL